jgi:cytochrome P450
MANYYTEIPARVGPELVRDYPLSYRQIIHENPFETMIPEVHKGPPAFMAPTAYLSFAPGWVFRRARDVKAIFDDTTNFIKKGNTNYAGVIGEDWDVIPTELDPPRHTAVRRVLNPLFTPVKVNQLAAKVRESARSYISKFKDRGHCELVQEFATSYPVAIFLELLGLPQDGMDQFLKWEFALIHAAGIDERAAGVRAVKAYLMEAIESRRKHPTDDLISNALRLVIDGRKLTPIEVFGHCFNLYLGGLDTVTANIGLQFMHLATHIDQQRQLRNDRSLIPVAMNELFRAYSATSHFRICAKDIEIAGVEVKVGDKVLLANPVANRDPEEYDSPNEVRFDRIAQNLTFGSGVHNCLGRHLARREVQVALEEILSTLPEFHLEPAAKIPFRIGSVIHVAELPLVWH